MLISVGIFLFLGVIGSILPILPGPPLSYIGLLCYHFFMTNINLTLLVLIGIVVIVVTVLDYVLQIYGVKKLGGGKYAIRGSILGMLLGILLLPGCGVLLGAFIGAYIGSKMEKDRNPIKIAFGSFLGFIIGTGLKLFVNFYIIYIVLF